LGGSGTGGASSATSYALTFDGSTTALADGSTVTWTCGSGSSAQCTTNWTPPAGVNWVRVVAWSGGAGGLGGGSSQGRNGGAGGGYYDTVCAVTPGAGASIAVGEGGGGVAGTQRPQNGGNTTFASCFTLLGATNSSGMYYGEMTNWPGYLSGARTVGQWVTAESTPAFLAAASTSCTDLGGPGRQGCIATWVSGGGGGGSGGGYGNNVAGTAGTSALGGAGGVGGNGNGSAITACTAGTIPGGGGGGGGGYSTTYGTGCNGARGEVRVFYTR
jgi:hypothetical protein